MTEHKKQYNSIAHDEGRFLAVQGALNDFSGSNSGTLTPKGEGGANAFKWRKSIAIYARCTRRRKIRNISNRESDYSLLKNNCVTTSLGGINASSTIIKIDVVTPRALARYISRTY